jgi:hypothetical protein
MKPGGKRKNDMTTDKKEQLIAQILDAAKRPCPEIVESFQLKGDNGNWYNGLGFPLYVKSTGERRSVGFVYRASNGTTYGKLYESRQAAEAAHAARDVANADDFRGHLVDCTIEQLEEKAEFWAGEVARAKRLQRAA